MAVWPVSSSIKGSPLFSPAPTKSGLSLPSNYGNSNGCCLFIQHIFIKHLLWPRSGSRCWGFINEQNRQKPILCGPSMSHLQHAPQMEQNFTGTISLAVWATLKGEGIISSIVLLWEVMRSRVTWITRGQLVHKGWRWDRDPGIWFLAIVTCPALLTGPRLPLLRLFPMLFPTVPSTHLISSHWCIPQAHSWPDPSLMVSFLCLWPCLQILPLYPASHGWSPRMAPSPFLICSLRHLFPFSTSLPCQGSGMDPHEEQNRYIFINALTSVIFPWPLAQVSVWNSSL